MRIPLWRDLRLSVWERQNPDAVNVTMPNTELRTPVRRVLSMRGWMLLLVRYDWRKSGRYFRPRPPTPDVEPAGRRLRAAEFTARHWHQAALDRDDIPGAHAIACIRAALSGETRPEQLGLDDEVHDAFRTAVAAAGTAATEAPQPDPCSGCRYVPCDHCPPRTDADAVADYLASPEAAHDREQATRQIVADGIREQQVAMETTARVFAGLHQSAEQDVTRVINLYEQWVKAGPPPFGVPLSRWWDRRLVELHEAILPTADQTEEQ